MGTELSAVDEMARDCLAVRVRLIGRAITAIYDRTVGSSGLTIAQVNMLVAAGKLGACSPSKLGLILQLERSTVSRNLQRLLAAGWVRAVCSDARRIHDVELTASGRKKVESIMPQWRRAQAEAAKLLGAPGVEAVKDVAGSFFPIRSN